MNIDHSTLEKVAHLARVEVHESTEEKMIADLEKILTWVEKLNEVDTSGVAPLTNMSFEKNRFRADIVQDVVPRAEGLKNAPDANEEFFKVPKVLDS